MFDILVDAIEVVHGPGIFGRGVQQVDAEGKVGLRVVEHAQHGGQDVDLLGYLVDDLRLALGVTGLIDDDGRAESAEVGLVIGVVGEVRVVAGQHEDGVLEPVLATGFLEEPAKGHVGIADAFVDLDAFLGEAVPVFLGHDVGVVAAGREDGRHEGLAHLGHLRGEVLEEGLVPDGPGAVEGVGTLETVVGLEVLTAVVLLEARSSGEGLEAHGASLGAVEEGRRVALGCQERGDAADLVHRGGSEEEGLDEHGDAREDAGHAVDGLAPVAEGPAEGDALGDEGVDEGGIAFVETAFEVGVQGTDILASEALDDEHDDILPDETVARSGMDGAVDRRELLGVVEVVGEGEDIGVDGAVDGEGGIEHECCFDGAVGELVGIRDGDGAHGCGETATDACHHKGGHSGQREQHREVVVPPATDVRQQAWLDVTLPEGPQHEAEEEDEDDVVHCLGEDDTAQVVVVGELTEHRARGASHRVFEVDGIGEVHRQGDTVDDEVHPVADLLPDLGLLQVQGEQHQHDVGDVGHEDGCGVEQESTSHHLQQVAPRQVLSEEAVVHDEVGHA